MGLSSKTLRQIPYVSLLCIVGGWADAIAYLRFHTFAGAMSGNSVLLGISLANWNGEDVLYRLTVIAAFLAAVVLGRIVLRAGIRPSLPLVVSALALIGSDLISVRWGVCLMAAALGMQTETARTVAGVSLNTVFVTGDLERFGEAVPDLAAPENRRRIAVLGTAWGAYVAGGVLGALAQQLVASPLVLAAGLTFVAALTTAARG